MSKLLTGYYYLFYRFYKLFEAAPSRWWSEWKAGAVMTVLLPFIVVTLIGYYENLSNSEIMSNNFRKWMAIILGGVSGIVNYLMLAHHEQWKSIIFRFDQLSEKKQMIGKLVFWVFLAVMIFNIVYYLYLMSQ